jgi:hypothetical protein
VSDASPQDPGSLTYERYFGLREKPFSLSSDPRFFFSNSTHGRHPPPGGHSGADR